MFWRSGRSFFFVGCFLDRWLLLLSVCCLAWLNSSCWLDWLDFLCLRRSCRHTRHRRWRRCISWWTYCRCTRNRRRGRCNRCRSPCRWFWAGGFSRYCRRYYTIIFRLLPRRSILPWFMFFTKDFCHLIEKSINAMASFCGSFGELTTLGLRKSLTCIYVYVML